MHFTRLLQKHATDIVFIALIVLMNVFFSWDYLAHGTKPANFDAIAHITTMAQFHTALQDGEFPVGWGDGFANYGLPLGTIAHQIPSYLGAILTFVTHDVLISFHLVYLIGAVFSAVFFYIFMRRFVSAEAALVATCAYSLAPYRIINFYLRGALPEFFSAVWVPLIAIAVLQLSKYGQRMWQWILLLIVSVVGLILTHPMMLIIYAPMLGLWTLIWIKTHWTRWIFIGLTVGVAVGITAYYFIPLNLETKYLYHGMTESHYAPNQTTDWGSFFDPVWRFNCAYRNDIFGRCHLVKAGVSETIIVILGVCITCLIWLSKKHKSERLDELRQFMTREKQLVMLWIFAIVSAIVSIAMSSVLFERIYQSIRVLGNVQYPWRYLSAFLFFPPILIGISSEYIKKYKWGIWCMVLCILFFVVARFPQLYAKNYTSIPQSYYYFTKYNLHSFMMNTIWSGDSVDYPVKPEKAEIVQGKGKILSRQLQNASRVYEVQADTEVLISDNTFYFPGWKVYSDGAELKIEFQDPAYRGVITFKVPEGRHTVRVVYEDTKVRLVGKIITVISLVIAGLLVGVVRVSERKKKQKAIRNSP